ncbi:predicted protein [Sclerotinia sclerotiorum 1980 UF-70]|uniref:Uncharacterized protein n=1 Tax=Sclerotinia sclerotiorum (strain ATCC 18683 / 1980 / Ss-1) TaxID=665079 RepID=A7EH71_SCLS1|nr:predicted protein [Sclerotinia sclerotiorum 1980 UF-70]EDO02187.1 predicted protein [Sclerotinia sclerotiorum 1980 UF-70]
MFEDFRVLSRGRLNAQVQKEKERFRPMTAQGDIAGTHEDTRNRWRLASKSSDD